MRHSLISFIALAMSATPSRSEEIATDRPDFVESSDVVGNRHLQIEMGSPFETTEGDGVEVSTFAMPVLLRYGISDSVELRLETDNFIRQTTKSAAGTTTETGYADVALGAKWHFHDGAPGTWQPAMALLAHLDVDSGSPAFRGEGLRPSLRLVAEWELTAATSFGLMPGVIRDKVDGERFWGGILAFTLGHQWTPRLRSFVEVAGQQLADERFGGNLVTYDAGFTFLVTESLQLDVSAAFGANSNTPDRQWGVGISQRM